MARATKDVRLRGSGIRVRYVETEEGSNRFVPVVAPLGTEGETFDLGRPGVGYGKVTITAADADGDIVGLY